MGYIDETPEEGKTVERLIQFMKAVENPGWMIALVEDMNNRTNMSLENIICGMYSECDSEEELEDKYNEIRELSACCLERRAEEIGLDPDTVSY